MRLSPNGRWFVMERGQHPSDGARRIDVVEAATGAVLVSFSPGFNPRWIDTVNIVAESATGFASSASQGGWSVRYVPANRGQLDGRGGHVAVSDLSRAIVSDLVGGALFDVQQAREPRLGVGIGLAVRHPGTGSLRYLSGPAAAGVDLGLCEDSRWDSGTLVWWLEGRVWGRTTIDQPTIELTVPGRSCSHPAPLWTGSFLYVGLVLDDGELVICEWGSLVRREALGWKVGRSAGAGFDWCLVSDGVKGLRVAYFDPLGVPVYASVDTSQPAVSLAPKPVEDRWALVPDGTVITHAMRALWGDTPSRSADGKRIYFAKNQPPQGEWRELAADGTVYHLFDQSRGEDVPTGSRKGWYLTPRDCCKWAKDTFTSGESFTVHGEKVEFDTGARVRWTHTITLYGLKAGGVMVRFDPRFPGMYEPAGYEHHYNRLDGGVRWEFLVTPKAAQGVIPWGNPSMDVLRQEAEAQATPGQPTPAYVEAPRLSVDTDPWAKPPAPKPPTEPAHMPLPNDSQMLNAMRRIHIEGYCGELKRFGGIFETPNNAASQIVDPRSQTTTIDPNLWTVIDDYSLSIWTGRYVEKFATYTGTGDRHEYAIRWVLDALHNSDEAKQKRGETGTTPPPPVTQPGSFRRIAGGLRREGKHFADDHGYLSPRGASCLYALCDGVDATALLDQYAAEGIQYVRVFAGELPRIVNGQDRGFQQTSADARARLPKFLAAANVRGLRVQVCMITDSALVHYDVYGHARECARIVNLTGNWLEGGNEIEDGEQDHSINWQRVLDECRSVGYAGLFTVGAGASDELEADGKYWPAAIGDFASTHPWRGHEIHWMADGCRLREGESISSTYDKPIAFGEPDNGSKQPEGYAYLIGALGAGFNAAVVYHSTPGRDIHLFADQELANLRAFVQGHQALEAGPWGFQNAQRPGNWPDSPVVAGAFEEGDYGPPHMLPGKHVWRVFSFEKDGRGFAVPTGQRPEDPGAFQIGNGRTQGADRGSRPGVRLVEISR